MHLSHTFLHCYSLSCHKFSKHYIGYALLGLIFLSAKGRQFTDLIYLFRSTASSYDTRSIRRHSSHQERSRTGYQRYGDSFPWQNRRRTSQNQGEENSKYQREIYVWEVWWSRGPVPFLFMKFHFKNRVRYSLTCNFMTLKARLFRNVLCIRVQSIIWNWLVHR